MPNLFFFLPPTPTPKLSVNTTSLINSIWYDDVSEMLCRWIVMCHQERECSACGKVDQKCHDIHLFERFIASFSLSFMQPTWPLQWVRIHQKKVILKCHRKMFIDS